MANRHVSDRSNPSTKSSFALSLASVLATLLAAGLPASAQMADDTVRLTPKQHLTIENPAELGKADAKAIYEDISDQLARGYAASDQPVIAGYRRWRSFNDAPYRSATHGNRYVNNFANPLARDYSRMESAGMTPPGAVLAKDSFTVTEEGNVFGAPLFVMEKLSPGASPKTADWRYLMLLADGSLFGDSRGQNADQVAFCHGCHAQKADQDYLFFVPRAYRLAAGRSE